MAIYREDIVDIELTSGTVHRSFLNHALGSTDNAANRFGMRFFRNGVAENVGGSCYGLFIRADGTTVAITNGTVNGNVAYVTLPAACYAIEGQFSLAIKCNGGGVTGTLRIVDGTVNRTSTETTVDPGTVLPSVESLIEAINEAVAAIPSDYEDLEDDVEAIRGEVDDFIEQFSGDVDDAVAAWLAAHPEATTTVEDGSLTQAKFSALLKKQAIKDYGTPEMEGAVGNGTTDDTTAFQNAINNYGTIVLTQKYKLTQTIRVPSHRTVIFLSGSQIVEATNAAAGFILDTVINVNFIALGGAEPHITGTCGILFRINGTSEFSISPQNYARYIRFHDIWVSSTNISKAIYMETAVRQVNIDGCFFYTNNGIHADGKTVEITVTNSIIWGTAATGGRAIEIESTTLGTNRYNEGWIIDSCTIDCTDKSGGYGIYISDIFVAQISSCYIGAPIRINEPQSTTHTKDITISNCVIYNVLRTYGNHAFNMTVSNCSIIGKYITIANNSKNIYISNCRLRDGTSSDAGVTIGNGAQNIGLSDLYINETYGAGVVVNGSDGGGISIHDIHYEGSGTIISAARPYSGHHNGMGMRTTQAITHGTYATSATIATCSRNMVAGESFMVVLKTTLKGGIGTGGTGVGQLLQVTVTNSSKAEYFIPFYNENEFISFVAPNTVTTTGTVTVTVKNYQGNSITTDYHDFLEIMKI